MVAAIGFIAIVPIGFNLVRIRKRNKAQEYQKAALYYDHSYSEDIKAISFGSLQPGGEGPGDGNMMLARIRGIGKAHREICPLSLIRWSLNFRSKMDIIRRRDEVENKLV